jgi:cysteine-rich repeat protein
MRVHPRLVSLGPAGVVLLALGGCGGDEFSAAETTGGTRPSASGGSGTPGTAGASGASPAGGASGAGAAPGTGGAVVVPPHCGDGNVDLSEGEQCDDGNQTEGDRCSAACQIEAAPTCGDTVLDLRYDEQCDDGNQAPGDGCSPTCQFEEVGTQCGNGSLEGREVCDDGNTDNGDGCNPTCNLTNTTSVFVGQPGSSGFLDDATGAGLAQLGGLGMLAVDEQYLYLADSGNHRVRRIEVASGVVVTIAGSGNTGRVDDAVGTDASFEGIESLATDGLRLWAGDEANCMIREIDLTPPHAVTTVAGNGSCNNNTDGVGASAELMGIRGLTYWNGMVYFLSPGAPTLRAFDPATGMVTTLAGEVGSTTGRDGPGVRTGSAANYGHFVSPRYMAHDNSGVLYIAETNGNKIRAYNTVTDYLATFAGDGTCGHVDGVGTSALLQRPRGMTSDGTSLYWVEFNEHTIRQAVLATGEVSTLLGVPCSPDCSVSSCPGGYAEGVGSAAAFANPFDIVFHFPSNSLFIVDSDNYVIRRVQ